MCLQFSVVLSMILTRVSNANYRKWMCDSFISQVNSDASILHGTQLLKLGKNLRMHFTQLALVLTHAHLPYVPRLSTRVHCCLLFVFTLRQLTPDAIRTIVCVCVSSIIWNYVA